MMKFTWQDTGARVFDGPETREGLLGGFTLAERRWLKREMKVSGLDDLDSGELRIAYYFLTIRQADHQLLPASRLTDLRLTDFELVQHAVEHLDIDGDCADCRLPVGHALHRGDWPEPDPTQSPTGSEPGRDGGTTS